jgi:hypothetical protein
MQHIREECAAKVATLIHIHGHAQTETWATQTARPE